MAHIRGTDAYGPVYFMGCDHPGCTEIHNPALVSRRASDARQQARNAGWRVHNATHRRRKNPDFCPAHRKATR